MIWLPCSTAFTTWAIQSAPLKHVKETLGPNGTWLIVEPFANDHLKDNLNPVGRVYYGASTMICTLKHRSPRRSGSGSAHRREK